MYVTNDSDQAPLTVGIIGAGRIGEKHCRAFARLGSDVQVVGVADLNDRRASKLAAIYSTRAFVDYEDLLHLDPDIAVICLPHHLHREVGLAAAEAGSHVLMEKPLANTLEDGLAIVEGCRKRGIHLAVGFVHRYRAEFQHAKDLIVRGELGVLATITDFFCISGGEQVPSWVWREKHSGGGILMYSGIHSIDWQCWLVGSEVERVFALTKSYGRAKEVENGLAAILTFENGCVGALVGNQPDYVVTSPVRDTEVCGSRGRLWIRKGERLDFNSAEHAFRLNVACDDPFVKQARDFVTALREGREPWITGMDGLRALAVVEAIYCSAELGAPVEISDPA